MQQQYTNIAFISYKREDEQWAKWLQKKLEHYKLPTEIRKQNPDLEFAKNPRHVFKDTTDLSGGVLAKAIKEGLDSSKYLIVICSPRAAKSPWVCKEVQEFIDSGREEYIIPFIIDGEPYSKDIDNECFPEALKSLAGERELLGININENGRDSAAVKVIAHMFDVRFDALWDRFQRETRKKRQYLLAILIVTILFLIGIIATGIWSYKKIENTNWRMMENQSRAVAEKARQMIAEGEVYDAILALLEVLPEDKLSKDRPYVPEAEAVLRIALDSINGSSWKKYALAENAEYMFTANDSYLLSIQQKDSITQILHVIEEETMQELFKIVLPGNYSYISSSEEDEMICIGVGTSVMIYELKSGRLVDKSSIYSPKIQYVLNSYTPIYLKNTLFTLDDERECPNLLTLFYKPEGSVKNVEVIDFVPQKKWLLYKILTKVETEEWGDYIESYKLFDISENTILWEITDTTVIPSNFNDVSISGSGNYLVVTHPGSLDIYNLNDKTHRTINTGDDSDHYSNHSVITKDENYVFQYCDFTYAHIYEIMTGNCVDSINNFPLIPYSPSFTQKGMDFVVNFSDGVECTQKSFLYRHNKDFLVKPKDISKFLLRENINKKITERRNSDNTYTLCYNDKMNHEWECVNARFIGYTPDKQYVAIIKDGYRGYSECQLLEVNSGVCMYSESPDYTQDEVYKFVSYKSLLNTCRRFVGKIRMTETAKKRFYLQ